MMRMMNLLPPAPRPPQVLANPAPALAPVLALARALAQSPAQLVPPSRRTLPLPTRVALVLAPRTPTSS
jgi:hypothetical protein